VIVTPIAHGLDLSISDLVRSPGAHASDVYNDYWARMDPDRYNHDGPPNTLLMAVGSAWEKHFEYLLLKNGILASRPGELLSPEGIAYSPDLIIFNGHPRVGEIKFTSMSTKDMPTEPTKTLPPKLDKYLDQMRLYAYWLELTHGWLAIVFNYRPFAPELLCFNLEWTERELRETHTRFMNHARHLGLI